MFTVLIYTFLENVNKKYVEALDKSISFDII